MQASKEMAKRTKGRVYGMVKTITETKADEEPNLTPRHISTACLAGERFGLGLLESGFDRDLPAGFALLVLAQLPCTPATARPTHLQRAGVLRNIVKACKNCRVSATLAFL